MYSGFIFVANPIEVTGELPIAIDDKHIFRAANDDEIEHIDEQIKKAQPYIDVKNLWVPYNAKINVVDIENGQSIVYETLPREQWRYWVITFEDNNHKIHQIKQVCTLLSPDLEFAFDLFFQGNGELGLYSFTPQYITRKYANMDHGKFENIKSISVKEISKISEYCNALSQLHDEHKFITKALENFYDLKYLSEKSNLIIVGYFSIIESLITHAPRLNETLDSINHQISNKMVLLSKMFIHTIRNNDYFEDASEVKVWKSLYSYRSSLAHGSTVEFNGPLQILKNHDIVESFLKEITKELIILGLSTPQFLADLRNC